MGRLVKWGGNALGALALIVITLNVEAVATALKLDRLLLTPGLFQAAVRFVQHPATLLVAVFVVGVVVGVIGEKAVGRMSAAKPDPNQKLHDLGYRMRNSAAELSHIEQWDGIGVRDHEKREAGAEVNSIMVDATRLGLDIPKPAAGLVPVINYLTEVGNWLSRGELDLAKQRATQLSKG